MARIVVTGDLEDLQRDLARGATAVRRKGRGIVSKQVRAGTSLAKRFARQKSGPHGVNYYKRISGEMTGQLEGEFGPAGVPKTDFVGAGYRNGPGNTDLARAADIVAPALHRAVRNMLDDVFWPGSQT